METNEANPPIVIKPDSHCVVTTASSHLHFAFDNLLAKLCNSNRSTQGHNSQELESNAIISYLTHMSVLSPSKVRKLH